MEDDGWGAALSLSQDDQDTVHFPASHARDIAFEDLIAHGPFKGSHTPPAIKKEGREYPTHGKQTVPAHRDRQHARYFQTYSQTEGQYFHTNKYDQRDEYHDKNSFYGKKRSGNPQGYYRNYNDETPNVPTYNQYGNIQSYNRMYNRRDLYDRIQYHNPSEREIGTHYKPRRGHGYERDVSHGEPHRLVARPAGKICSMPKNERPERNYHPHEFRVDGRGQFLRDHQYARQTRNHSNDIRHRDNRAQYRQSMFAQREFETMEDPRHLFRLSGSSRREYDGHQN